jgi:hypothetical protein
MSQSNWIYHHLECAQVQSGLDLWLYCMLSRRNDSDLSKCLRWILSQRSLYSHSKISHQRSSSEWRRIKPMDLSKIPRERSTHRIIQSKAFLYEKQNLGTFRRTGLPLHLMDLSEWCIHLCGLLLEMVGDSLFDLWNFTMLRMVFLSKTQDSVRISSSRLSFGIQKKNYGQICVELLFCLDNTCNCSVFSNWILDKILPLFEFFSSIILSHKKNFLVDNIVGKSSCYPFSLWFPFNKNVLSPKCGSFCFKFTLEQSLSSYFQWGSLLVLIHLVFSYFLMTGKGDFFGALFLVFVWLWQMMQYQLEVEGAFSFKASYWVLRHCWW